MLIFAPADAIFGVQSYLNLSEFNGIVSNMSSATMVKNIEPLLCPMIPMDSSLPEFDLKYAEYLFTNDEAFSQFMNIIIMPLANGVHSFIMIDTGDWFVSVAESVLKLIQQRYGYNGYICYTTYDILDILNNGNESSFSIEGLFNLDADMDRLSKINFQKTEGEYHASI